MGKLHVEVPVVIGEVAPGALASPGTGIGAAGVGGGVEHPGPGLEEVQDAGLPLRLQERIGPVVDAQIGQRLVQLDLAPVPVDAVEAR